MQTKKNEAMSHALRAADASGLPQTLYKNADSCGWWHTNALANLLQKAETAITVLPSNYFSR